jgi:hypothetical protein
MTGTLLEFIAWMTLAFIGGACFGDWLGWNRARRGGLNAQDDWIRRMPPRDFGEGEK